jgi:hypothetical protein
VSGSWINYDPAMAKMIPRGQEARRPYRAECTRCRWKGPVRYDPTIAQADGAVHARKEHPGQGLARPGEDTGG